MGDFKRLLVWRKAHALAINVHRIAMRMRGPGTAELRSQMIRAALSIPTNIVEGHGQESPRNFARFLGYSLNSGAELEQHLLTGQALEAVTDQDFLTIMSALVEVRKMTYGLRTSLSHRESAGQRPATEKSTAGVDSDKNG
jgi:four helix bundle protein